MEETRREWDESLASDCEWPYMVVREFLFDSEPPARVRYAWEAILGEVSRLRVKEASLRLNHRVTLESMAAAERGV